MIQFSKPFLCIICSKTNSAYIKFVRYVKVSHRHHLCKCQRIKKTFRIDFVSVINLHTKFNMTGRHVSLLKEYYKTKTISVFQAMGILFQSKEEKEDEHEEEEEEESKLLQWKRTILILKPVNKKKIQDSPLMGFQMYALRGILQLLCKMEFDSNT